MADRPAPGTTVTPAGGDEMDPGPPRDIPAGLRPVIRGAVRRNPGIELDALIETVAAELLDGDASGRTAPLATITSTEPVPEAELEDLVVDELYSVTLGLCDEHGPLVETADGKLLDLAHMLNGKVFTHRVGAREDDSRMLDCGFDLWALSGFEALRLGTDCTGGEVVDLRSPHDGSAPAGEPIAVYRERHRQRWSLPMRPEGLVEGATIAVRVDAGGTISITVLDETPPIDEAVLEAFWSAYDLHREVSALPPGSDLLVVEMLLDEPATFDAPTAPLSDYARAAGLEVRRALVADSPEQWRVLAPLEHVHHLGRHLDLATRLGAIKVLMVADTIGPEHEGPEQDEPPTPATGHSDAALPGGLATAAGITGVGTDGRQVAGFAGDGDGTSIAEALEVLCGRPVRDAVSAALFTDREVLAGIGPPSFLDRAIETASSPEQRAVVHLLRHRSAVHLGDIDTALDELAGAVENDPGLTEAVERLAWFSALQGDATRAAALWRQCPPSAVIERNLDVVEPFTAPPPKPGRNQPCWCGSGRKYKKCHIGVAPVPALSGRVQWLWHKAVTAADATSTDRTDHALAVARSRAGPDAAERAISDVLGDPLTQDLVLTEGRFFEQFLEDFGSLLPDDELRLGKAWTRLGRSVYEITAMSERTSATLSDLPTGTTHEVLVSPHAPLPAGCRAGTVVCARVLPDGADPEPTGHQIIGGTFAVPQGTEESLVEALSTARAEMSGVPVARWLSEATRAPVPG